MTRPTSSSPKTRSTSNNAAVIMSFAVEKESQFGIYSLSVPTRHGNAPKKRLGYNQRSWLFLLGPRPPATDNSDYLPPSIMISNKIRAMTRLVGRAGRI